VIAVSSDRGSENCHVTAMVRSGRMKAFALGASASRVEVSARARRRRERISLDAADAALL
jgi:hypothetical protein